MKKYKKEVFPVFKAVEKAVWETEMALIKLLLAGTPTTAKNSMTTMKKILMISLSVIAIMNGVFCQTTTRQEIDIKFEDRTRKPLPEYRSDTMTAHIAKMKSAQYEKDFLNKQKSYENSMEGYYLENQEKYDNLISLTQELNLESISDGKYTVLGASILKFGKINNMIVSEGREATIVKGELKYIQFYTSSNEQLLRMDQTYKSGGKWNEKPDKLETLVEGKDFVFTGYKNGVATVRNKSDFTKTEYFFTDVIFSALGK